MDTNDLKATIAGFVCAAVAILGISGGVAVATVSADHLKQAVYTACVESGKQLVDGNCVR